MAARPVTELDKSEVLSGLFAVWDDIDALLQGLPEAQWKAMTPLPAWTVQAVVAHIIGTESFLEGISAPEPDTDVKELDHVRNDIGAMNECWCATSVQKPQHRSRAIPFGDRRRRKALESMSVEDWNAQTLTPAGPDSYGRFYADPGLRLLDA